MIREIVTASQHAIKIGVVNSQVASVRTQVEQLPQDVDQPDHIFFRSLSAAPRLDVEVR